jgi:hypothetical protein
MRVAFHGVRRRLQDDRVAGGQALADLVDGDLEGVVPRHDGPHHAHGFLGDLAPAAGAEGGAFGQVALPGELVDEVRRPPQALGQRGVQLRPVGEQDGGPHLGHQLGPQQLLLLFQGRLQLEHAALAQLLVGRPGRLVEGPAGRRDGLVHVLVAGVGHLAEYVLGRRVDVVEHLARLGLDQLAVDQHPELAVQSRVTRCHVDSFP